MTRRSLDVRYRWLSAAPVSLFGAAFGVGLAIYLFAPASTVAARTLDAGILILIAAPAVRLAVATAEQIRRRDRGFLLMIAAIVLELLIVVWRAAAKG